MTPIYLNPHNSPFPLEEPNEDQQLQLCSPESQASSSSLHGGSTDHQFFPTTSLQIIKNDNENIQKFLICKQDQDREDNRSDHGSIKWMSSKMRLMKKMMNSGEEKPVKITHKFDTESSNIINIRTCSDCNTTKTPLWRSGPRGPKSLCNACGIRQRKARRASMAAGNGTQLSANISSVRSKLHQKEKKQCKTASSRGRKKICFEDFFLSMSENSAFKRVFPQDERDAAILLMALSCGLVHG